MQRWWLALVVTACVVPPAGRPYPPATARDPARVAAARAEQARAVARQVAADYDAVLDKLAAADRQVAAKQDEQAVATDRAAAVAADQLLAWFADPRNAGRAPDIRYPTRHDGELSEAALRDNLRALRRRAGQGAAAAWDRYVVALEHELGAQTPGQRAVLLQHGRPEVAQRRRHTCWTFRGDTIDEVYCWTAGGNLVSHTKAPRSAVAGAEPAPAEVDSAPEPPPAPAPAPSPVFAPAPAPAPAARAKSKIAYYAAATFASGACSFGNCLKDGWTTDTPGGSVRTRCNFGDCTKDGWTSEHPDGSTSRTSCHFGNCFKEGWTTEHPDGTRSETRCNFGDCMKDGWTTSMPDGSTSDTSCHFGDCLKEGWTTRMPSGGSVSCSCSFGDCLKNGASCG